MTEGTRQPAPGPSTGPRFSRRRVRGLTTVLGLLVAVQVPGATIYGQSPASGSPSAITPRAASAPATAAGDLFGLIPSLTGEGAPADRRQAALQILQIGSDEAIKALTGVLSLKNNTAAKLAICDALSDMDAPPPGLAEPLLDLLKQQKDQQVHDAAVAALYRYSTPRISQELKNVLEDEELQWLRTENVTRSRELYNLLPKETDRIARLQTWLKAAQPLDRLTALEIVHGAMLATTPLPPGNEVLQQLRLMLRDPDERVRRKLVVVLRDLQEKEDVARFLAMLEHERSPTVLEEIYKTLGRMGNAQAITACIKGLADSNANVAAGAADALGRLCRKVNGTVPANATATVTALVEKASQPLDDPGLRGQVIEAMAEIADPKFLTTLVEHARPGEKVPQIRQAALAGIGQIGDAAQVDLAIARLAEDVDAGVREAAAEALGYLGSKPAHLRPLTLCLTDSSGTTTVRAWEAYRRIFARLAWTERLQVAATWSGSDKVVVSRRIDLLGDLESQAATLKSEASQLLTIREDLGDALVVNADYALAAGAYTRALEGLTTEQANRRIAITGKLLEAYLRIPSYDKATALAAGAQSAQMVDALADRLLRHVEALAKVDGKAAVECIGKFKRSAPDLFLSGWGAKLEAVRQTTSQPATVPAR